MKALKKKGEAEWTVRKVVVLILLLILLVLIIWGLVSGKLAPLHKNLASRFDAVLILLGMLDEDGRVPVSKDCVTSRGILVPLSGTDGIRGDFSVCKNKLCWFNFTKGIGYAYYEPEKNLFYKGADVVRIDSVDDFYNYIFNEGKKALYSSVGVKNYRAGGTSDGLERYMGGLNGEVPSSEDISKLREALKGKSLKYGSLDLDFSVEIGAGGYPVVVMGYSQEKYGLIYVGEEKNPKDFIIATEGHDGYDEVYPEIKIQFEAEPLRLVKWKEGENGNLGWYSEGDVKMNMIPRSEFLTFYELSQIRIQTEAIRKIFEEKCR